MPRLSAALFLLLSLLSPLTLLAANRAEVLLIFDPAEPLSSLDAEGIRQALAEQRTPFVEWRLDAVSPSAETLSPFSVAILAHARLDEPARAAISDWVSAGGGLLSTGVSASGLETLLGIAPLQPLSRLAASEVRFQRRHPVSTGSYWQGPISQIPPMPASEFPSILQLLYLDQAWPAYTAQATAAEVLARWRDSNTSWFTDDGPPAVMAHRPGAGRSLYVGALPGAYADPGWQYPLSWRTLIDQALQWLNRRGSTVQLGHWPHGQSAAMALTADTERADMASVVPDMLAIFQRLGLTRFATFFIVGRAGGDALTEGAQEHPQTVAQILEAGSELAGHGDVHTRFEGQARALQRERLQRMVDLIEPAMLASGQRLLGFRGPGLAVDRNTFDALADVGLAYDSSQQDVWTEATLPYFARGIWHLPASSPMDFALLERLGLSGSDWEDLIRDKLAYVQSRRGLFNWVVHPWIIQGELARIESVLADIQQQGDIGMYRLDDVLYWWLLREELEVELVDSDAWGMQLRLSNRGSQRVEGASLWLRAPDGAAPRQAYLEGQSLATLHREHGLDEAETFEVLVVPELAPGASVRIDWRTPREPQIFADGFEP